MLDIHIISIVKNEFLRDAGHDAAAEEAVEGFPLRREAPPEELLSVSSSS